MGRLFSGRKKVVNEEFEGFGTFCPSHRAVLSEDDKKVETEIAENQRENESYWASRWQKKGWL